MFLFDLRLGPNFLVLKVSWTLILGAFPLGDRGKAWVKVLFRVLAVVAKMAGFWEGLWPTPPKVKPPRPVPMPIVPSSSTVELSLDGLKELLKYLVSEAFSILFPEIY